MAASSPPVDDRDRIDLRVPADARYARVVRVAVSAYGLRLGLAPTAIDDLRLAVDEALILLLGPVAPNPEAGADDTARPSAIVVTLDLRDGDTVVLDLELEPEWSEGAPDRSARSRFEEIVPSDVVVERLDQARGRITLLHAREGTA